MNKATFIETMDTLVTDLIGDVKFQSDIIHRGQQLVDSLTEVVADNEEWDEDFAVLYAETITHDHLFRGAEVVNGVAVPENTPDDEEMAEPLEMIQAQAAAMPDAARAVMFEASRTIQSVLARNPA